MKEALELKKEGNDHFKKQGAVSKHQFRLDYITILGKLNRNIKCDSSKYQDNLYEIFPSLTLSFTYSCKAKFETCSKS